jgi:hypothetical protein
MVAARSTPMLDPPMFFGIDSSIQAWITGRVA